MTDFFFFFYYQDYLDLKNYVVMRTLHQQSIPAKSTQLLTFNVKKHFNCFSDWKWIYNA